MEWLTKRAISSGFKWIIFVPILGLAVVPFYSSPFVLQIVNQAGLMAIGAMALTVLTGTAGLLSLGHAAFLGIGGFTAGLLSLYFHLPMFACAFIAGMVGLVVGMAVALATLRTSGIYLTVGTLALQYIVAVVLVDIEVGVTAAQGFVMPLADVFGWKVATFSQWWALIFALLIFVYFSLRWLMASHLGRSWMCARDEPIIAEAMGIPTVFARARVFMLTSFLTSFIGAIGAFYLGIAQASNYDLRLSIIYLTAVVIGRLGSLKGAIIGAFAMTALPHVLAHILNSFGSGKINSFAGVENVAMGIILSVALLQLPQRGYSFIRQYFGRARGEASNVG